MSQPNAGAGGATPIPLTEAVAYADDAIVSKTLLKADRGNITLFAFDAGQGLSEHTAPFDAVVHVLEGQARVRIAEREHAVSAGQMIIMPANIPHAIEPGARFKMLLTMIKA